MAGARDVYNVQTTGGTLTRADMATSMKVPTSREFYDEVLSLPDMELLADNAGAGFRTTPVNWNLSIPYNTMVLPQITVTYDMSYETKFSTKVVSIASKIEEGAPTMEQYNPIFTQGVPGPLRDAEVKSTATGNVYAMDKEAVSLYHNPPPSPINKFLESATVDFGTGRIFETNGPQQYLVKQMTKERAERDNFSSKLNNGCLIMPYGSHPVNASYENNVLAIPGIDSPTLEGQTSKGPLKGHVGRAYQRHLNVQTRMLATNANEDQGAKDLYNLNTLITGFVDSLEIEPFVNLYELEEMSGLVGVDQVNIRLQFRNRFMAELLQPVCTPILATNTTIALRNIRMKIRTLKMQDVLAPICRGISNHVYQRLEVFSDPLETLAPHRSLIKHVQIKVNSIPQLIIARVVRPDYARSILPVQNDAAFVGEPDTPVSIFNAMLDPNAFDSSVRGIESMRVRVSDLGETVAELSQSDLKLNLLKRGFASASWGCLAPGQKTHWAVFDPIQDIAGLPRAAEMACVLTYDIDYVIDPLSILAQGLGYLSTLEVICVHYNFMGNRENRFTPTTANFSQAQVNDVFNGIERGSIVVSPISAAE